MSNWYAAQLPAPLNAAPGFKSLEQAVNGKQNLSLYDVRDYGPGVGQGSPTVDDRAFVDVIKAANGAPVVAPVPSAGNYLVAALNNLPGVPLTLWGQGTRDNGGTVIQSTSASPILTLNATAAVGHHDVRDVTLSGGASTVGGLALGDATHAVSFTKLKGVRIINCAVVNAYGIALNQVQELDAENVQTDGNYNNIYRPNLGSVTTASFHGPTSHCGSALNVGVLIDGPIFDLSFKDKFAFESNANEAIKSVTQQIVLLLDDVYSENNNTSGGAAAFNISGPNAGSASDVRLVFANLHKSGSLTANHLRLDYARAVVEQNFGLFSTDALGTNTLGLATTANSQAHFVGNARGADAVAIYQALPGTITWDEIGLDGVRNVGGKSGGLRFLGSTPASAAAAGTIGTVTWDANYVYICTGTNAWKRVAIATW